MLTTRSCLSKSEGEDRNVICFKEFFIQSILSSLGSTLSSLPSSLLSQSIAVCKTHISARIFLLGPSLSIHFFSLEFLANSSLDSCFSFLFSLCGSSSHREPLGGACGQSHDQGGIDDWLSEMIDLCHQIHEHEQHEMIALIGTRLCNRVER